jgi:phosphoglycerate dehydrogenase-like enzyme
MSTVQGERVAVTSRSFSRHPVLRAELCERFPNARFNDEGRTLAGDELIRFLEDAELAITALERIDDAILERLPRLRRVSKVGVGTDMLEVDAFDRRGIDLVISPGTNARSVTELALMMAIGLLRHVPEQAAGLAAGGWSQRQGSTLTGRTVGIVGFGNVGQDLARALAFFSCKVFAHDVHLPRTLPPHVESASLEDLLRRCDIVSLHVSLTPETRGLIDSRRLSWMKPSAILINTSRGGLIDEEALLVALTTGRLGGAGLDTFADEPPGGSPLLGLPNVFATPHIGGSTAEAVLAMGRAAIAGLTD